MAATVFAFHARRAEARPWQNHELAEFYRVIDVLARAGLGVIPDMGVSDEGDPWFAFCCAETGEVIAHCARIDGMFVATSVAVKKVYRGFAIRDVVDAITRSNQLALLPPANRRLYLHPAAVLVAFIAAALLFSKEASAHEMGAGAAASGQNPHASLPSKLFAALKFAVSDALSGLPALVSPHADTPNPGLLNLESPIPLAALTSVAMAAIAPALTAQDAPPFPDSSAGAPARPVNFADLHPSIDLSLFAATSHNIEVSALDSGPATGSGAADSASSANFGLDNGTLHLAAAATDIMAAPASSPVSIEAPTAAVPPVVTHIPPPPHYVTVTSSSSSSPDSPPAQPSPPAEHAVDLSDLSPTAIAVFFGTPPTAASDETASHAPTSVVAPSSNVGSPESVGSTVTMATSSGGSPATPATIVIGPNPNAAIAQLLDYALTNHPIQAPLAVSSTLAADLRAETGTGGSPIRLVVFDSDAMKLPVFDFVQGIVFVNDHELGLTLSQASPAQVVTVDLASGGIMKLLGVVDTAHITF